MTQEEMQMLKKGIQDKYRTLSSDSQNDGKYPPLKYNSYPASYENLRDSMREELTKLGLTGSRLTAIPSAKTFSRIFYGDYILKEIDLLDTCYIYVWGKTRQAFHRALQEANQKEGTDLLQIALRSRFLLGFIIVTLLGTPIYWMSKSGSPLLSELVIKYPIEGQIVSMNTVIEGSATNADTLWPVVCDVQDTLYWSPAYYVQTPVRVQRGKNIWKVMVRIGGPNKLHIGQKALIRVFANPSSRLKIGQRLYAWPNARASSKGVKVVRGFYSADFAKKSVD